MRPVSPLPVLILACWMGLLVPAGATADTRIYDLSELDIVTQVVPEYPRQAMRAGFDGWVQLEFTVNPQGAVEEPRVVESSSKIFHREALLALQGWQFKPVAIGGEPTPVRAQLKFSFRRP